MMQGQKSNAVRKHNAGKSAEQIADDLCVPLSEVLDYLGGRPGYPGKITCKRMRWPMNQPERPSRGLFRDRAERPKPSLPKLSFLED